MLTSSKSHTQKIKRERRHLLRTARTDALQTLTVADLMRPATDVLPFFTAALEGVVSPLIAAALSRTLTTPLLACDVARHYVVCGAIATYCMLSDGMMCAGFVGSMLCMEESVNVLCEFLKVIARLYYEDVVVRGEAYADGHVPKKLWVARKLQF